MVLAGAAPSIERLAAISSDDIELSVFSHVAELGVDGGQPNAVALRPQLAIEVLGRDKPRRRLERRLEGAPLLGHADGRCGA